MSNRATPEPRRVTRASSRAASDDVPASVQPSGTRTRKPRAGRATPSKEAGKAAPKVTNKQSRAYGAQGKPSYAQKMSAAGAMDSASKAIESAVQGAEEAQLQSSPAQRQPSLPSLSEAENESENESEELEAEEEPLTEEEDGEQSTWLGRSRWFDISTWAPREHFRSRQEAEDAFYRNENDFWKVFDSPATPARGQRDGSSAALRWPLYLLYLVLFGLALTAMFSIGSGPLLHTNFDSYLSGRRSNVSEPVHTTWQHTVDFLNTRINRIENQISMLMRGKPLDTSTSDTEHKVNWFAAGNGAVVVPRLSSPTDMVCDSPPDSSTWWSYLFGNKSPNCHYISDPPAQALHPWTEPHQRWCAPPSRGKLQLTIITPRHVAPTDLIVEHIPKGAAIRIGDAPKEIELWAEIPEHTTYQRVSQAIFDTEPSWLGDSLPQQHRELHTSQALPRSFRMVGRWTYNIYARQHVQSFHIPLDLKGLGVKSNRFAVRVNSNWGDYAPTCLYRVLMHGEDVSGEVEDLDPEPREPEPTAEWWAVH